MLPTPLQQRQEAPAKGWRERWRAWRDRTLTDPAFQRQAVRWPLARLVARRRARSLFDLVGGFVYSQVLLACVRLRAFEVLAQGTQDLHTLSRRLGLPSAATQRLLDAAAALELAECRGPGLYGLGRLGAPLVGNEALTAMIEHHAVLYADLADPVALLRGEGPPPALARYWAYATAESPGQLESGQVEAYSALMSASQPLVAEHVLDAYDVRRHRCLLDVGGGQGRFLLAAARRAPALRLMLFDLPPVVQPAHAAFASAGVSGRAQVHGGDFTRDELPRGAVLVSLVRVIYDHGDARALAILRAAHAALPPGGTLLLAEPMAGAPGAARMGDAYFGFYLLAMGSGRSRTADDLRELVQAAGFEAVRELPSALPVQVGVLVARKAARA